MAPLKAATAFKLLTRQIVPPQPRSLLSQTPLLTFPCGLQPNRAASTEKPRSATVRARTASYTPHGAPSPPHQRAPSIPSQPSPSPPSVSPSTTIQTTTPNKTEEQTTIPQYLWTKTRGLFGIHPRVVPPLAPFNGVTNPYRARKKWPPNFRTVDRKYQFHFERTFRRRIKLKYLRPTYIKGTYVVQWFIVTTLVIYFIFFMEQRPHGWTYWQTWMWAWNNPDEFWEVAQTRTVGDGIPWKVQPDFPGVPREYPAERFAAQQYPRWGR